MTSKLWWTQSTIRGSGSNRTKTYGKGRHRGALVRSDQNRTTSRLLLQLVEQHRAQDVVANREGLTLLVEGDELGEDIRL